LPTRRSKTPAQESFAELAGPFRLSWSHYAMLLRTRSAHTWEFYGTEVLETEVLRGGWLDSERGAPQDQGSLFPEINENIKGCIVTKVCGAEGDRTPDLRIARGRCFMQMQHDLSLNGSARDVRRAIEGLRRRERPWHNGLVVASAENARLSHSRGEISTCASLESIECDVASGF
jgi:hypothetical protein